jgi:NADPH-dependent 2,4-dienoyl-CoA reductase/sulfur reductase-like enzyme
MAMPEQVPLAVIGAGPAGLVAVAVARQYGIETALLDEQPRAGGQIYRNIGAADEAMTAILGPEYAQGRDLLPSRDDPGRHDIFGASVWQITRDGGIYYSHESGASALTAEHIILATGAIERPMPIPGWTLPGVMTAGAGQTLLKNPGLLPQGKVVLAGSGPLLWPLAAQYGRAGVDIAALVETTPRANLHRAALKLPGLLREGELLRQGRALRRELKRLGPRHFKDARGLRAVGEEHVRALCFTVGGQEHEIPCDLLLLHMGVTPNVQFTRALDLPHDWDDVQRCWRPRSGPGGATEISNLRLAGDGAGIVGARAAALQGRLAALAVAGEMGEAVANAVAEAGNELSRRLAARPFLDRLFAPGAECLDPPDDTIVCRCEEVTAGGIRDLAARGCRDVNQLKALGRPGMGPCQGRMCGLTVAEVLARSLNLPIEDVDYFRLRWPAKPVSMHELAMFAEAEDA